jgi:uncharacterized protein (DUF2126 family)
VLQHLKRHGFAFEMAIFRPYLDFRFPILAEENFHETSWSVRRAAEPWPLLGEQPAPSGGLVRCVDSSTERLEIRLSGKTQQILVFINGLPLPLVPHPDGGVVGAVRCRVLALPTCLHPQIAPHLPLEIHFQDQETDAHGTWHYQTLPVKQGQKLLRLLAVKNSYDSGDCPAAGRTITLSPEELTLDLLARI